MRFVGLQLVDFLTDAGIEVIFGLDLALVIVLLGLLLMALEAIAPGANFIVIGVAMAAAGVIGLAVPALASPLAQAGLILLFGSVAVLVYQELDLYGGKGREQTSDSSSLLGREGYVTERVTRKAGAIKLDTGGFDPHYRCRTTGDPIPVGTRAVVVDPGGGNVLEVEPVEDDEDPDDTA